MDFYYSSDSQPLLAGRLLAAGLLGPVEQPDGLAAERQGEGERQRRPQLGHPRVAAAAGQAAARGGARTHQGAHQGTHQRGIRHISNSSHNNLAIHATWDDSFYVGDFHHLTECLV